MDQLRKHRRVLFMCAPSFQGGHSATGEELSVVLGVPFPIDMKSLEAKAKSEGFDIDDLWPWLAGMRAGKPGQSRSATVG